MSIGKVSRSHAPGNLPVQQGKIISIDHGQPGCPAAAAHGRLKLAAKSMASPSHPQHENVKETAVCLSALGYMRLAPGTSELAARRLQDELAVGAEREGYTLVEVFIEREAGGSSAFAALIEALTQYKTPVVLILGMCHFAHLPGLRTAMKDHVERETGARVVIINQTTASD